MAAKQPPIRWPWTPLELSKAEISAVKGISPEAFAVIQKLTGGGGGFGNPFTPGGEDGRRATDFGCGKLWVGNTLAAVRAAKIVEPRQHQTGPHAVPIGAPPGGEIETKRSE